MQLDDETLYVHVKLFKRYSKSFKRYSKSFKRYSKSFKRNSSGRFYLVYTSFCSTFLHLKMRRQMFYNLRLVNKIQE